MKGKPIVSSPFSINVVNSDKRRGSTDSNSSNNEKSPSHLAYSTSSSTNQNILNTTSTQNNNNNNYSKPLSLEIVNDYSTNVSSTTGYRRPELNDPSHQNNLYTTSDQSRSPNQQSQYFDANGNSGNTNSSDLPNSPYRSLLLNTADLSPKYLFSIGSRGTNFGEFHGVFGVATDHTNKRIIATDCHNNRIQVFNEDGKFIFAFGQKGNNDGEFQHPTGVGVGPRGEIVVCERLKGRVQVR